MLYLNKIFYIITFFLFNYLFTVNSYANDQIIFKLDNEIFTTIDLDNRKKYLELLNKNKLIIDETILNDLINISIYNIHFQKTKKNISKNFVDNLYKKLFKQYEINKNENYLSKVYKDLTKEIILKNIRYDLQKKIIIEEKLNKKKEFIFKKSPTNELKLLYDFSIEYFIIKKEYIKNIKTIINDINYNKISKQLEDIQKQNIKILHKTKKIGKIDNLNINLKNSILSNNKYFYFENNSNVFVGKIIKKLKNENKIDLSLYQIVTKNEIPKESIKCNNLKNFDNNEDYQITNKEVNYGKINKDLKLKLNSINDFVIYRNENTLIYIILCKLKFDKNVYEQININDNINKLVKEINNEFMFINKKKYNLEIINE